MLTVGYLVGHVPECFAIKNIDLTYQQAYCFWREFLFSRCVKLFKWQGLPFKQRELEIPLLLSGYVFITGEKNEIPKGRAWWCSLSDFEGDYFDEPLTVNVYAPKVSKSFKTSEGVLIDNTTTRLSFHSLIHRYACMLAHNVITFMQVIIWYRNPKGVPVIATSQQKDTFSSYLDALKKGEMSRVVDPTFMGIKFVGDSGKMPDPREFLENEQNILASFFHDIGVRATKGKKGNMLTPEIEGDNTMLLVNVGDMLECREEGRDEINKRWGWNCNVELNPDIAKALYETAEEVTGYDAGKEGEDGVEDGNEEHA